MKKLILLAGLALMLAGCAGGPPVAPPDPGGVVIVDPSPYPPYPCRPFDPYCVDPIPVPPPVIIHPVPRPEPHPPFGPRPPFGPGPGPVHHRDVPADTDHGDHQH